MISRRTTLHLADFVATWFSLNMSTRGSTGRMTWRQVPDVSALHDFFYVDDFPAWVCNASKRWPTVESVRSWVMQLHTGESQQLYTKNWSWEQRRELGQRMLRDLAESVLKAYEEADAHRRTDRGKDMPALRRSLELDGYTYSNRKLHAPESDVLDVQEEQGVLRDLHRRLGLAEGETAFHHLALSESHYLEGRWDDTISNSRKFLESVLQQAAHAHASQMGRPALSEKEAERPVAIREYLEREALLEKKEREALDKVYALLSHTGGHPYMAAKDQARLLRQLALMLAQFVMLRVEGAITAD